MTRLVRLLLVTLATGVSAACELAGSGDTAERREARRLYLEALDHAALLRDAPATERMRQALRTDPTYVPALNYLMSDGANSSGLGELLDSVAAQTTDPWSALCVSRAAALGRGLTAAPPPSSNSASSAARLCNAFVTQYLDGSPELRAADINVILARTFPEFPSAAIELMNAAIASGGTGAIRTAVRAATQRTVHPMVRAEIMMALARMLHDLRLDSAALDVDRAVARDPGWTLPGFRAVVGAGMFDHMHQLLLADRGDHASLRRHGDSVAAASNTVRAEALRLGDQRARLKRGLAIGTTTLDRGMVDEAMPYLQNVVPLADSVGDVGWQAYARMRLGRALVKAGRAVEGESILLAARRLGASAQIPYVQREIEHNLLHLYESLQRDADALHAGEAFVRFASTGRLDGVRMMSSRDVGRFLRARGRITESRQYFNRMLAAIDSLGMYRNYAGEYHELTGDLDRAKGEYEKALGRSTDQLLAVAGLVRVSIALGDTSSALRWARIHDESRRAGGYIEAAPLLPSLRRRGATAVVARESYRIAREDVLRHGQLAAWAVLTTELADLESDLGNFENAAPLADSAREAAIRVGDSETAQRARAVSAASRLRRDADDPDRELTGLQRLAHEVDRTGSVLLRAHVWRLLAGARASRGQWREALDDYRRAVTPLDSVAAQIAMDPGQAAFRSAQRRAYDDALTNIVHHASSPGAAEAFAAWSTRRKGRTYAVQWPVGRNAGLPRPGSGHAIIDFVMLDSVVAAMVVTNGGAAIIRLDARPADLRADVLALRRAVDVRVGTSLDAGRAKYSLPIAHRLYQALLQPLEPHLRTNRKLLIVADGILALVPFDALVMDLPYDSADYARATYVLDRYTVANASTMWSALEPARVATRRVMLIDPGTAPDAGREVAAVMTVLKAARVTLLQGARANRRETIAALHNADVVHVAAHSGANEHDPSSSRIDLSPDGTDDGRLGATEVASLRLAGPLVVLSACETANGVVLEGEGVLSLSRAFLRAGARATVATLWPVGPSAADFAEAFYASLVQSQDGAGSIRAAKLVMRSRGIPPMAWAPYQLFVAPSPHQTEQGTVATLR